jgi:protein phosphatase
MCSDGLSDMLDNNELSVTMDRGEPLPAMAAELILKANAAGGRDNISVLLIQAKRASGASNLMSRFFGNA